MNNISYMQGLWMKNGSKNMCVCVCVCQLCDKRKKIKWISHNANSFLMWPSCVCVCVLAEIQINKTQEIEQTQSTCQLNT